MNTVSSSENSTSLRWLTSPQFWYAEDEDRDPTTVRASLDDYSAERVEEAEYESSSESEEEGDSDEGDGDVAKEGVDKDEAIASSESQRKD